MTTVGADFERPWPEPEANTLNTSTDLCTQPDVRDKRVGQSLLLPIRRCHVGCATRQVLGTQRVDGAARFAIRNLGAFHVIMPFRLLIVEGPWSRQAASGVALLQSGTEIG